MAEVMEELFDTDQMTWMSGEMECRVDEIDHVMVPELVDECKVEDRGRIIQSEVEDRGQ
jgi:hypothetical protein